MLRINLLPPEYRRPEAESRISYVFIFMVPIVFMSMLIFYLWHHMILLEPALRDKAELEALSKKLADDVAELRKIKDKMKVMEERQKAIDQLRESRIMWSRKLDQFMRLLPDDIWVSRLQSRGGNIEIDAHCLGTNPERVGMFFLKLKSDKEFWSDFSDLVSSQITLEQAEGKPALRFPLRLIAKGGETSKKKK